jgi:hypothetical protein
MLCVACGAQMHLVEVRCDDTMMVRGYEHHTFECTGCREIERRLTFSSAKRASTGRIVQIFLRSYEATYAAKDTNSGMVVMRNQDHQRLRERVNGFQRRQSAQPKIRCEVVAAST